MDRDPTGQTWLLPLLELGSRSVGRLPNSTKPALIPNHPRWWGNNERRLDPPKSLLRWLIANASAPASEGFWGGVGTRAKRERLVARDPEVIAEALRLLESSSTFRKWYVLEGRSQPDACFETDAILVVIEGKRKERKATAVTTWMRSRSQMLRHMDAALEISRGKRVLGLMIVEGEGGAAATAPSDRWLREADNQLLETTVADSLPHRDPGQRKLIADGFLGVATWQRVCAAFELGWPPYEDSVDHKPPVDVTS